MKITRPYLWLLLILLLLAVAAIWSLLAGEVEISLFNLWSVWNTPDSLEHNVLMQLRLPRLLLAFSVGASLSLAGGILQGIYRNPLVEPFTLGISGGASLAVAGTIVLGGIAWWNGLFLPVAGFGGALLTVVCVYLLGTSGRVLNINKMLLTGVMVSFVCASLLMFLLSISSAEDMYSIVFWTMGSLDEPNHQLVALMVIGSFSLYAASHWFANDLNALRLGESGASHLGVNVTQTIRTLFIITSILTGLCVSVAGIIGFVGLVVPHAVRRFCGTDYRWLLSFTFWSGGLFLIVCDVLARTLISPNELPVGVITGIVGGITFIFLLRNKM